MERHPEWMLEPCVGSDAVFVAELEQGVGSTGDQGSHADVGRDLGASDRAGLAVCEVQHAVLERQSRRLSKLGVGEESVLGTFASVADQRARHHRLETDDPDLVRAGIGHVQQRRIGGQCPR